MRICAQIVLRFSRLVRDWLEPLVFWHKPVLHLSPTSNDPYLLLLDGSEIDGNVYPCGRELRHAAEGMVPCARLMETLGCWSVMDVGRAYGELWRKYRKPVGKKAIFRSVAARRLVRKGGLGSCMAVFSVKERSEPVWTLLEESRRAGIATVHYPHGFIGEGVLPLRSQYVWFWNHSMKARFMHACDSQAFVAGYWFPSDCREPPPSGNLRVLLVSQYHGFRQGLTDNPDALKDIFPAWGEVMKRVNSIHLNIRFHPYDTKRDREEALALLDGIEKTRIKVVPRETSMSKSLENCDLMTTVSSTAIVDAGMAGRPVILYGISRLVEENLGPGLKGATTPEELIDQLDTPIRPDVTEGPQTLLERKTLLMEFLKKINGKFK